jgi:hypothetical protein
MSEKLWGAEAIGAAINRNPKQTYHLVKKGLIRSARRVGERWVVDKDDLQREFSVDRRVEAEGAASLGQSSFTRINGNTAAGIPSRRI